MIQKVGISNIYWGSINTSATSTKANSTDNSNGFLKTLQNTATNNNYSNIQDDTISPEDMKYLGFLDLADGSTAYFPPLDSSIATKKAWIDAMKQMTPQEQFEAKSEILAYTYSHKCSDNDLSLSNLNGILSQITSYQKLFEDFINEEQKQISSASVEQAKVIQHMLNINTTILNTFIKNKIS